MRDALLLSSEGDPELSESLSPRERQLLVMATNGLTDQGIAHELGISVATVSTYWGRVRIKFGPHPRTELVAQFMRSEMARVNEALSASESRFRTVLEASPMGIILTDTAGKALYVNPAYERITGHNLEAQLENGSQGLVHPDDRERVTEIWERCLREGTPYTSEHRYVRPDGGVIWVRSRGDSWYEGGKIAGRVSLIEDVTATHEAERARAEAESRYRTLLALAPEAILSVDEEVRVVEFNPGAERMFGYEADEVIGEPLAILLPESFRPAHLAYVKGFGAGATAAARPMASRSQVRGLRRSGEEFPCEASIMRQLVNGRPLYTAILRDISGR